MRHTQRVHFRLIVMPCCHFCFCNVNPRLPSYCPECGTFVAHDVRSCVTTSDENAILKVDDIGVRDASRETTESHHAR